MKKTLGATVKGQVEDTGGGAFGLARLAKIVIARLQPDRGRPPRRPSDPSWIMKGNVPMSKATEEDSVSSYAED
ncbi:MAG: hypothetical protein QGF00_02695 [Planctomycetota bacterium]|nr:hypothetical protein [Planctomycetota bacterium]MDP7248484.1 hypothetical protein [Planctomycetota bacterium]